MILGISAFGTLLLQIQVQQQGHSKPTGINCRLRRRRYVLTVAWRSLTDFFLWRRGTRRWKKKRWDIVPISMLLLISIFLFQKAAALLASAWYRQTELVTARYVLALALQQMLIILHRLLSLTLKLLYNTVTLFLIMQLSYQSHRTHSSHRKSIELSIRIITIKLPCPIAFFVLARITRIICWSEGGGGAFSEAKGAERGLERDAGPAEV